MPEVADEPLVRPEEHRAQRRVQPVRPDHQVEAPPGAAREGHVDAVRVLGEPGDPVAEDVLGTVPGVVVEYPGQVPAQDLDLRDVPVAAVVVRAVGLQYLPVRVHGVRASGLGAGRAHGRVQPHPPDDLFGHPARVHRLPTGTQPGGPLHYGHPGAPPAQPVGQGRPRDARPRHQHLGAAHSAPRSPVRIVPSPTAPAGRGTAVPARRSPARRPSSRPGSAVKHSPSVEVSALNIMPSCHRRARRPRGRKLIGRWRRRRQAGSLAPV